MKNRHLTEIQSGSDPLALLSESKMLPHLSGIKIVSKGEIPADLRQDTEFYDLLLLPTFTLCACYLGYANYRILGEDSSEIPVASIWSLFNFISGLTSGRQIMERHLLILAKAFELLGFHADLAIQDHDIVIIGGIAHLEAREDDKTNYIGFDEKGIKPAIFSQMLARALPLSL